MLSIKDEEELRESIMKFDMKEFEKTVQTNYYMKQIDTNLSIESYKSNPNFIKHIVKTIENIIKDKNLFIVKLENIFKMIFVFTQLDDSFLSFLYSDKNLSLNHNEYMLLHSKLWSAKNE